MPHPATVHAIEFSPDGERLATAAMDAKVRVYDLTAIDAAAPKVIAAHRPSFTPPRATLIPPRFLDDGRTLITIPRSNTVAGLDPATSTERFRKTLTTGIMDLAVAPDGRSFWTAGFQTVSIWSSDGTMVQGAVSHRNTATALAPLPDGRGVVTSSRDRFVRVLTPTTGANLLPPLPHTASVWAVACSADNRRIATVQEDGLVRVWTIPSGPSTRDISAAPRNYTLARFAAGGRYVLPSGGTFTLAALTRVRLHDPAGGESAADFRPGGVVLDADASADGRLLVAATTPFTNWVERDRRMHGPGAGNVQFWDVSADRVVGPPVATPSEPRCVRFRPDGLEAAVLCADGEVLLFTSKTGQVNRKFRPWLGAESNRHYVNTGALRYSVDGRDLYVYGLAGSFIALDPQTGRVRHSFHLAKVFDGAESPDGRVVAVGGTGQGGAGENGLVKLIDRTTGRDVVPPLVHPDWVFSVRFSRDGKRLLTACRDQSARLWDWRTGKLLAVFPHTDEVFGAAFALDEQFVVTVSIDKTARVWAAASGRPVTPPVQLGGGGLTLDLTPDGRYAVVGGFMPTVKVIDLAALTTPADGSIEDLTRLAELAAGQRINEEGGAVNLTGKEWMERWREYRTRNPLPASQ